MKCKSCAKQYLCDKKKCEYIPYSKVKNYGEITKEVQSRKVKWRYIYTYNIIKHRFWKQSDEYRHRRDKSMWHMHGNRARELCKRNISRFRTPAQTTTHPHKIKSEIAKVGARF